MEALIHNRVYFCLETNHILTNNQWGFRKEKSTQDATASLLESVLHGLNLGKHVGVLYVDLRNAFDSLSHDILLTKLFSYGIRNSMLDWFHSYLSGRKQRVFANGLVSQYLDITHGVPQGLCLSPLVFLMRML